MTNSEKAVNARILKGDLADRLADIGTDSIDAVVTDPPYGIRFMGKAWDGADIEAQVARQVRKGTVRPDGWERHDGRAFAAGTYDRSQSAARSFQLWTMEWATAVLRVAKPGAHMVVCASPRTFHRVWSGVEDAGWEIRDTLMWLFGQGFPKSSNQTGDWQGWGTALKPGYEPIVLARKALIGTVPASLAKHGVGALNIDGCRVDGEDGSIGRWPANVLHDGSEEVVAAFPDSDGQLVDASSSSSSRKTQHVYGAMRRGSGREGEPSADSDNEGDVGFKMKPGARRGDSGSAARFFWCPKASRADRNEGLQGMPKRALNWSSGEQSPGTFQAEGTDREAENFHPTVKPTELMQWLCRLVAPRGATVLDPFMGSGSTGKAAVLEGMNFVGIELESDYVAIAERRIAARDPLFTTVDVE